MVLRVLRRIGAIVVALAVIGGGVGLVWADRAYPTGRSPALAATTVTVPPGGVRLVCPRALQLPSQGEGVGGDVVYDPQFSDRPVEVESVNRILTRGVGPADVSLIGGQSAGQSQAADGLTVLTSPVEDPLVAAAQSGPEVTGLVGGGGLIASSGGDLTGLAGAACQLPAARIDLVGGATQVGSTARLILVNPGEAAVSLDVTVWGPDGRLDVVGTTGLVIPASSQRVVPLEALAADLPRTAVQVEVSGGQVAAFLQHTDVNGLDPAGVDLVAPSAEPSGDLIIPAIVVPPLATEPGGRTDAGQPSSGQSATGSGATGESAGTQASDDAASSLIRVLVPGQTAANVGIVLWGPDGPVRAPGLDAAILPAGSLTDIPITGVTPGVYTAHLTSDQPVVAAAQSVRLGPDAAPVEFAWSPARLAPAEALVPLLDVESADLALAVGAAADAVVTVRAVVDGPGLGPARSFEIAGGTTRTFSPAELAEPGAIGLLVRTETTGLFGLGLIAADSSRPPGAAASAAERDWISVLVPVDALARSFAVSIRDH